MIEADNHLIDKKIASFDLNIQLIVSKERIDHFHNLFYNLWGI